MSQQHNPLSQFEIQPLIDLHIAGYNVSFTNSALFMALAFIITTLGLTLPMRNAQLVPSRGQSFAEIVYQFIASTIKDTAGDEGKKYLPFIFSVFIFVLACNLLGMLPYSFTATSHIIVTFAIAALVFIVINIIAFSRHGLHFFTFFVPSGTPWWIAPLMIVIEFFTYLARPITLAIRLAANMVAGHVLIKVIAGFAITMGLWAWLPVGFIVVLTGMEIFVAILQAYVFTILTCVYLNDAINLH
jgi:F-type H+-transporting ATPase subunit a